MPEFEPKQNGRMKFIKDVQNSVPTAVFTEKYVFPIFRHNELPVVTISGSSFESDTPTIRMRPQYTCADELK